MPTVFKLGRNGYVERVSAVLSEQCMPIVHVEVNGLFTLAVQVVSVTVCNGGIDQQGVLIGHAEAERSDIHGDGDT